MCLLFSGLQQYDKKTQRLCRRIPAHSKFGSNCGGCSLSEIFLTVMVVAMEVSVFQVTSCYLIATVVMAAEEHVASTYTLEVQGKHKLSKFALCSLIFYAEDGGRMFLLNASILHIGYRTPYTKIQYSVCPTYIANQYFIEFPGVLLPSRES